MASSKPVAKGNKVELKTFSNWNVDQYIAKKTIDENNRTYVVEVRCTLCTKYVDKLLIHPNIRGAAKDSVMTYVNGTNSVTKNNVLRHINSRGHACALGFQVQQVAEGLGKTEFKLIGIL